MKKLFLMAAMLLMSVCTFAQSGTPLKGDVNGDGKVDVADIVAVIEIMKNNGSTTETIYYWYISLTPPTDIQTVDNPAGTAQEGWHLIGTSTDGYEYDATNEDTLFNSPQDITDESECIWYVALPQNTPLKIYDAQGILQMTDVIGTVQCAGITYDVLTYGPLWRWDAYIVKS